MAGRNSPPNPLLRPANIEKKKFTLQKSGLLPEDKRKSIHHFAAPLPAVATPIFGAGVALRANILPAPNIAKCGTLYEIFTFNFLNMFKWKKGTIVKIILNKSYFSYGRLLDFPLVVFYDGKSNKEKSVDEIINLKILFKVWCHKSILKIMERVGHKELEENLKEPVKFYKQDPISKRLYIYDDHKEIPAKFEDIKNLECAAVWEPEHILERLNSTFKGTKSIYVESLKVKPNGKNIS